MPYLRSRSRRGAKKAVGLGHPIPAVSAIAKCVGRTRLCAALGLAVGIDISPSILPETLTFDFLWMP
jgi:hypothetical protein